MPKLTSLKPIVSRLPQRIGEAPQSEQQRSRHRKATQPWRKWYYTERWSQLRQRIFLRDMYTCKECGKVDGNTSRLVAHHTKAHRGNPELFWDETRIATACKPCHDGPIQAREQREQITGDWS